jgi:hypothetical protein
MAENHALRKRGIGLILVVIQLATLPTGAKVAMLVVAGIVATLIFIDAMGEDVVETPSVYVPFVRIPVAGRMAGLFLYPGWAAALWFSLLVGGLLLTEVLVVGDTGGSDALIMVLSYFASLLFPAALKRTFRRGNAAVYYIAYFAVSLLLAALIGTVHGIVSADVTREVVGFVPLLSFVYAAAHEIPDAFELPIAAVNGTVLLYSGLVLLAKSRAEWKKIRAQEAKALALHVASS